MNIGVIGTGYVGLVVGTCLAESGNQVICVDVDEEKIKTLNQGQMPIYEPGLKEIILRNKDDKRLTFSTQIKECVSKCQIIFITVGTPSAEGGQVDLKFVLDAAETISKRMDENKIIVIKSTVPCQTVKKVEEIFKKNTKHSFDIVANPEFLKEGVAVDDFMRPDRVVVGLRRDQLKSTFERLYSPFLRTGKPIFFMSPESAEMTKYAANGLLAVRISYMNEIANLCDQMNADVNDVRKGIGADSRIGYSFLFPGVGYGGSCFPKDVDALVHTAKSVNQPLQILDACAKVNRLQHHVLSKKIKNYFKSRGLKSLSGKKIALWGLSFKPQTDDLREAPSLTIIKDLLETGAEVSAFDPVAMIGAEKIFAKNGLKVTLAGTYYEAVKGAHALALVTEWNEFRRPDFLHLKELMQEPAIFDGRNIFDPQEMIDLGFYYEGIGRKVA